MREEHLRRSLQSVAPPGELDAERRTWAVVKPLSRSARPVAVFVAAAVAAALVLAGVVARRRDPAGPAVVDAVRDAFGSDDASSGLRSLPAPGRLLVTSSEGVQGRSPGRLQAQARRLRRGASWSPAGKFAVVTDERHVLAVELDSGDVHWSLTRSARLTPRWMPGSGTRVAYRSGATVRVVDGDGTGDGSRARGRSDPARLARRAREPARLYRSRGRRQARGRGLRPSAGRTAPVESWRSRGRPTARDCDCRRRSASGLVRLGPSGADPGAAGGRAGRSGREPGRRTLAVLQAPTRRTWSAPRPRDLPL